MGEGKQEQDRADRDHERSDEAHWQVAEAGAEEQDEPPEAAHRSEDQQDDWENEGGAVSEKDAEDSRD